MRLLGTYNLGADLNVHQSTTISTKLSFATELEQRRRTLHMRHPVGVRIPAFIVDGLCGCEQSPLKQIRLTLEELYLIQSEQDDRHECGISDGFRGTIQGSFGGRHCLIAHLLRQAGYLWRIRDIR